MMAGAALVTSAAIATADAHDDAFIARMHALGFTWPPAQDPDVINMAHQICHDRWNGYTPDSIAQDIHSTLGGRGITFGDVTSMVSLTESFYCPS
jgi:Protein of unknown function (DUF732)